MLWWWPVEHAFWASNTSALLLGVGGRQWGKVSPRSHIWPVFLSKTEEVLSCQMRWHLQRLEAWASPGYVQKKGLGLWGSPHTVNEDNCFFTTSSCPSVNMGTQIFLTRWWWGSNGSVHTKVPVIGLTLHKSYLPSAFCLAWGMAH